MENLLKVIKIVYPSNWVAIGNILHNENIFIVKRDNKYNVVYKKYYFSFYYAEDVINFVNRLAPNCQWNNKN